MASTIRVAATQHWAGKALSRSKGKWLKRALGAAQKRDRSNFPTNRLCDVVGVSTRGLRALRSRPASRRQRSDLVTLAHIKEQSRLSLGSYGRPRMTEELKEIGLDVGHRRVGRLMRQNGISVVRTRKHKVTTDSDHKFNIAPNLLDRDFNAAAPNQKWAGDISYIWTREGWLYLAVILDLHSRRVIGWAVGMLDQITAFCSKSSGTASLLFTMDLATPSYPNPDDLPLHAVELTIDGQLHSIGRRDLTLRYGDDKIFITVPIEALKTGLTRAREIDFRLDSARVMGGFREGGELSDIERQSLALAWRNCI